MTLEQTCHLAGFTMILCCMCFLDSWFACILFLFSFGFVSWHNPLCAGFCFSYSSCFVCLFPDFGWMHFLCVSVLSLPVQCWSLSYGKQRRPFRLYAPTWLRQQVWRPFYFFCTWSLFFLLQPSLSFFGFLCMSHVKHLSRLIFLLTFSESEIPSQERKNYKSSPEIQVG